MSKGLNPVYVEKLPYWIFLYEQGFGHKTIAKKCGVPRSATYTYLKHFGIIKSDNVSILKRGSMNPMWRGKDVTRVQLHVWVRKHKPRPDTCEDCGNKPSFDLANISNSFDAGTYTRDFYNWVWLCRSCHMKRDGRINNLRQYNAKKSIPL